MRLQRTRFQPRESGVVLMTHLARVLLSPLLAWDHVCRMVEAKLREMAAGVRS